MTVVKYKTGRDRDIGRTGTHGRGRGRDRDRNTDPLLGAADKTSKVSYKSKSRYRV
jgi:hypothetical protein